MSPKKARKEVKNKKKKKQEKKKKVSNYDFIAVL